MITWFHGTLCPLPGELILSPRVTGARCASDLGYCHESGEGWHVRDRVYVAASLREAAPYAMTRLTRPVPGHFSRMFVGPGVVYEVEIEGQSEPDPEYPEGMALRCERARIVRAHALPPDIVAERSRRRNFVPWEDLS